MDYGSSPKRIIPIEVLLEVMKKLPPVDVTNTKLLNRKFNTLVKHNLKFLPRNCYDLKIVQKKDKICLVHSKKLQRCSTEQDLATFDYDLWNQIEICSIELKGITLRSESTIFIDSLRSLCQALKKSRQNNIRSLSLKSVTMDESSAILFKELLSLCISSCKQLLFRDCVLPNSISADMIAKLSAFEHYRWIDSRCEGSENSNELVLRKFTSEIRNSKLRRSFRAEVNTVNVVCVCEFIDTWINFPNAYYFNLTLQNCDATWKTAFVNECNRKGIEHNFFEFGSKTHENAHIKVNFIEETQTCRMWPIFDLPARSSQQVVSYARYYRDFR